MGQPELADDPRYATHEARGVNQTEVEQIVADWVSRHASAEVDRLLSGAGIACGPIYDMAGVFSDPLFHERDMLVEVEDPDLGPLTLPGIVPQLSVSPGAIRWTGPLRPGSHNAEIFQGLLGLSDTELRQLSEDGVI